jgi:hypothetical protein
MSTLGYAGISRKGNNKKSGRLKARRLARAVATVEALEGRRLLSVAGGLAPPVVSTLGKGGVFAMAVADVNGDGMPDLIVANDNGTIGILPGYGNGQFGPEQIFPDGLPAGAGGSQDLAVGANGQQIFVTNAGADGMVSLLPSLPVLSLPSGSVGDSARTNPPGNNQTNSTAQAAVFTTDQAAGSTGSAMTVLFTGNQVGVGSNSPDGLTIAGISAGGIPGGSDMFFSGDDSPLTISSDGSDDAAEVSTPALIAGAVAPSKPVQEVVASTEETRGVSLPAVGKIGKPGWSANVRSEGKEIIADRSVGRPAMGMYEIVLGGAGALTKVHHPAIEGLVVLFLAGASWYPPRRSRSLETGGHCPRAVI